ncbi:MAG: hypothetical protein C5B54_04910 [Acidobacteria bacterium]|nr:MAG: hypothetical protein C5B54_04910 [Acidobacteriota bacterium]
MSTNILSLEFKKQKITFFNTLLTMSLSAITFVVALTVINRTFSTEFLGAFSIALSGIGVPVLAMIYGATAAYHLRTQRNIEELLPVSAVKKVFASYLVSLPYYLCSAVVILMFTFLIGRQQLPVELDEPFVVPVVIVGVFFLHLLSFAFTYWLALPVLGVGLAAMVVFTSEFFLFTAITLPFWTESKTIVAVRIAFAVIAGCIGATLSLFFLSKKIERETRIGFFKGGLIALGLCCCAVSSYFALHSLTSILERRLTPSFRWRLNFIFGDPTKQELQQGAFFETFPGGLVEIDQTGKQRVLSHPAMPLKRMNGGENSLKDFYVDSNKTVWILRVADLENNPDIYEILKAPPDKASSIESTFRSSNVFPQFIDSRGQEIVLYGTRSSKENNELAFAPLPQSGKPPEWSFSEYKTGSLWLAILPHRLQPLRDAGKIATLQEDGRVLTQKVTMRSWHLPGIGQPLYTNLVPSVFGSSTELSFALPVQEDKLQSIVICHPDGSISKPWNFSWQSDASDSRIWSWIHFAGGTRWRVPPQKLMLFIGSDGSIYPPLSIPSLYQQLGITSANPVDSFNYALPIRLSDSHLWMTLEHQFFIEVDLSSGKVVHNFGKLTDGYLPADVAQEGIYYISKNQIHMMNWNGEDRDLGGAWMRK